MKTELSLAELLADIEIVQEHIDRNFPGVEPPRLLRDLQVKLDHLVSSQRKEIAAVKGSGVSQAGKGSSGGGTRRKPPVR